jgi:hypothetical protein
MIMKNQQPIDPDLRGVPDALLRAAEAARRLAQQAGTPFIAWQPGAVTADPQVPPHQPAQPSES